jgi:hypothetical protein
MIKKVKVWSAVNVGFIALLFFVVNHFAFKDVAQIITAQTIRSLLILPII